MSRYEAEAQAILLRRRRVLRGQQPGLAGADPASRWTDWEAGPAPLAEPARRELDEIDAALQRLGEGRYGRCQACGGPLGLQRIRAIPEARYCVGCSGQASDLE